jgi:hypothetical protein
MTLEADFLASAADKLAENLDRIETCLTELPPPSLWARDSENENAVGNLLLHLSDHSPDQALHWERSRFLQLPGQDGPERNRAGGERSSCGRVAHLPSRTAPIYFPLSN